jgi:hypothetical protein
LLQLLAATSNCRTCFPCCHVQGTVHLFARSLKADSHIACHANAAPMPCRADKGFECVFPIRFKQCDRVWFTLAMPRPCHVLTMPFFSRPRDSTAVERRGLPARLRLLAATTRSSTKIVIRSIPKLLTTIHTYDCKEWYQRTTKNTIC